MSRMAATSPASMSCSYVITSTPGGGAIFITTSRLSARCSRYATLHQPCPSSVAKSSVGGTSPGPYARSIIRRRVSGDCRYLVMLSIECLPPGRDPTDAKLPAPKGTGSFRLISDQWKMLTPPGPTSRPTTMRTMPHNSCFRMIAKMPEITRIAAIIHRIVAIYFLLLALIASQRGGWSSVRSSTTSSTAPLALPAHFSALPLASSVRLPVSFPQPSLTLPLSSSPLWRALSSMLMAVSSQEVVTSHYPAISRINPEECQGHDQALMARGEGECL